MAALVTLPICCVCNQVPDEDIGASSQKEGWTALELYLNRHPMDQAGFQLSHTYCPSCFKRQARAWRVPLSSSSRTSKAKKAA